VLFRSLATKYAYLNPSTDDTGRAMQSGDIQYEQKNYAEAERVYRSVLEKNPKHSEAAYSLGVVLRAKDDHAGAALAFANAASVTEDRRQASRMLVNAAAEYARADRNDDALQTLRLAFDAGFDDRESVAKNPVFAKLKDDPRMKTIVAGGGL